MASTFIEISRANLLANLQQWQDHFGQANIWPVIKSNAYGHGLKEITNILASEKSVAGLLVVNLAEAKIVRSLTDKPIMVLSYFEASEAEILWAIEQQVSLPIYDLATASVVNQVAAQAHKIAWVNIKLDSGTRRLGVDLSEATAFIRQIEKFSSLKIFSLYTHLAESESEDLEFSQQQVANFLAVAEKFPHYKKHWACSAASLSLQLGDSDLIRLGLSLYGLWPSASTAQRAKSLGIQLKPVLAWRTKIIQIKDIQAGDSVGYNRTYIFPQPGRLAVLPLGYFEGYSRILSNQSRVLIKGVSCPVRGNICMNLMMVELPVDLDVKVGEVATLLGTDGKETISAEELASTAQTINYEIVARLNAEIPKIII